MPIAQPLSATKPDAFRSRGEGDHFTSHDLEDLVVVEDGRPGLEEELSAANGALRRYAAGVLSTLLEEPCFVEVLPGYFAESPGDGGRERILIDRLRKLASQSAG